MPATIICLPQVSLGLNQALGFVDEIFGLLVQVLPLLFLEIRRLIGLLKFFQVIFTGGLDWRRCESVAP